MAFNVGDKVEWVSGLCFALQDKKKGISYLRIDSVEGGRYSYTAYDEEGERLGSCSFCLGDRNLRLWGEATTTSTISGLRFKVGDVVRYKKEWESLSPKAQKDLKEDVFTIACAHEDRRRYHLYTKKEIRSKYGCTYGDTCKTGSWGADDNELELVSTKKTKTFMSNIIDKVKMLTIGEPTKTFIKAGISDLDGNLNADGKQLFWNFMLSKFGAEFKTEVVDKVAAEIEKEKSCGDKC